MTELDLDAVRALVAATSGETWELVETSTLYMNGRAGFTVRMDGKPGIKATITAQPGDAELMVAARALVPALLDRIAFLDEDRRETWADLDKAREERDAVRGALVRCAEQRDEARAEMERLRAELDQAEQRIWRARHTVNGKCRYCWGPGEPGPKHQMRCRHYVGPLVHAWDRTSGNQTFGGIDYWCRCGGWFRRGGAAGHGDGTAQAVPVCPDADEGWRGPREEATKP